MRGLILWACATLQPCIHAEYQSLRPMLDGPLGLSNHGRMKPLFIPLKTRWFRAFAEGRKTVEYRAYGPRWHEATCIVGREVVISHGYSGDRIHGVVIGFKRLALHDAPSVAQEYFAGSEYIAAISIQLGDHLPRQAQLI